MKRFKVLMVGLVLGLGILTGCDAEVPNGTTPDSENEQVEESIEEPEQETESPESDDIENGEIEMEEIAEENSYEKNSKGDGEYKTLNLSVYVSSDDATTLKREVRPLKVEDMRVGWAVLNALKEDPEEDGAYPAVPKNISFNKLVIKEGIAIVDFDDGGVGMGSAGESMFIESVILSLTKFPTVEKVRFTRNGEENPELGNVVLDGEYDRSYVTYSKVLD